MVKIVKRIIDESTIGYTKQGWCVSRASVVYDDGSTGTLYRTTLKAGCVYGLDETHPPVVTHEQATLFEVAK